MSTLQRPRSVAGLVQASRVTSAVLACRSFQLKVKGLPSADPAPTFAAEPIWRKQFHSAVAEYKETERKRNLSRAQERLAAIPLWR